MTLKIKEKKYHYHGVSSWVRVIKIRGLHVETWKESCKFKALYK